MSEQQPIRRNARFKDLTGMTFGRLTVLRYVSTQKGHSRWECACSCSPGARKVVSGNSMISGQIKSCGCFQRELAAQRNRTHGLTHTLAFRSWMGAKARCTDIDNPSYGKRGIKMCAGWSDSFQSFIDDLGPRPSRVHTLDRKDVNGNYSCGHCPNCVENGWPMNCRWATVKQQNRNKQNTHIVTYNGKEWTIPDLAESLGIDYEPLFARIVCGWDVRRAVTEPVDRSRPRHSEEERAAIVVRAVSGASRRAISDELGIPYQTVVEIIRKSLPPEHRPPSLVGRTRPKKAG